MNSTLKKLLSWDSCYDFLFIQLLHFNLLAKTDTAFKAFLDAQNPRRQHSSTLESYLIKPIQRILKYPLLLKELFALTDVDSEEHYHLDGTELTYIPLPCLTSDLEPFSRPSSQRFKNVVHLFPLLCLFYSGHKNNEQSCQPY